MSQTQVRTLSQGLRAFTEVDAHTLQAGLTLKCMAMPVLSAQKFQG